VTQGASVFVASHNWIKSEPLPLSVHVFSLMANSFVTFSVAAIPTLIVCFLYGNISAVSLLSVPACLLIYAINGVWVSAMIGAISARHRDVLHFVEIFREPFCSGTIPVTSWIVVASITVIGSLIGFGTFAHARKQIIFWL
jgi:ABC-type polysaccharide/polyol phosphate export permease